MCNLLFSPPPPYSSACAIRIGHSHRGGFARLAIVFTVFVGNVFWFSRYCLLCIICELSERKERKKKKRQNERNKSARAERDAFSDRRAALVTKPGRRRTQPPFRNRSTKKKKKKLYLQHTICGIYVM